MKVIVEPLYDHDTMWLKCKELAYATVGLETTQYPTSEWKSKILKCTHSPIRAVQYQIEFQDIPYWISVHLSRHKIGAEHFVRSQRTDRTGVEREKLPQDTPVNHIMVLNAEAFINISKRRLCAKSHKETVYAWQLAVTKMYEVCPELADRCVPTCIAQGHCTEYQPCGYQHTVHFTNKLEDYRDGKSY